MKGAVAYALLIAAPAVALQASAAGLTRSAPRPRLAAAVRLQTPAANDEFAGEASVAASVPPSSELIAANEGKRVAVSGLTPDASSSTQQQAPTAGVEASPPQPAPSPTFMQKAKAPFMGFTALAMVGITVWQSKIKFAQRQEALLDEFAATMVRSRHLQPREPGKHLLISQRLETHARSRSLLARCGSLGCAHRPIASCTPLVRAVAGVPHGR